MNFINSELINNNSGCSHSLWMDIQLPFFPKLETNMDVDVCVVGAGIAGLTCAYTMVKQGKTVIVVDQGSVGGGETARTTAHLSWVLNDRYYKLEKLVGKEGARLAAESHSAAIDYIEKIIRDEDIDCDFERLDGHLFVSEENSLNTLDKEYIAVQKTGKDVHLVEKGPNSSSFDIGPCLRFPQQAQFHVLKYLKGLTRAILKYGGKIFSETHVTDIKDNIPCTIKTKAGPQINSKSVIIATCTPINNRLIIHTKQAAYRTYVLAGLIPKGSVPKGLYWDTHDPYHYIRLQKHLSDPNLEWLIIGGEDHKTGQENDFDARYDKLEKWAKKHFPVLKKIEYRWSGQIFESLDSLGFIGRNPRDKNIYISTGDSGNGMTHGTIAGILIPNLIEGKTHPWKHLYKPSRKMLSSASKYLHEALNMAMQYKDWFTPGDNKKIKSLHPEEGMILRKGIRKIAIYKDKRSNVCIHSAFCPHLGGCVRWNSAEKSWDCPCHGSRFNGLGKVITGPANSNLSPCSKKISSELIK